MATASSLDDNVHHDGDDAVKKSKGGNDVNEDNFIVHRYVSHCIFRVQQNQHNDRQQLND